MLRILSTLALAAGVAAPLFKFPVYAVVVFTFTILWNHIFPSTQPSAEVLLLPTKKPYLAALKPLDDPTPVQGEHCPTCWDELDATNAPTRLACGHVFCNEDIKDWLNSGRNTCPVCKKVLFQQAMFQGNDAIKEKVHKARVCLIAISLLITILRQPLAFVACNPAHLSYMHWSWDYLNPFAYLTGYGPWYKNVSAFLGVAFDVMQLLSTYWGYTKFGPAWFRIFPGHWAWWFLSLYSPASQIRGSIEECRHYGLVAWRICQWRWEGSPGSFLFWRATVVPAVKSGVGDVLRSADDLVVEVTAAWDEFGNKII
jgi:hypothetical protein